MAQNKSSQAFYKDDERKKGIEGTLERLRSLRDTNLDIKTVLKFMICEFKKKKNEAGCALERITLHDCINHVITTHNCALKIHIESLAEPHGSGEAAGYCVWDFLSILSMAFARTAACGIESFPLGVQCEIHGTIYPIPVAGVIIGSSIIENGWPR